MHVLILYMYCDHLFALLICICKGEGHFVPICSINFEFLLPANRPNMTDCCFKGVFVVL